MAGLNDPRVPLLRRRARRDGRGTAPRLPRRGEGDRRAVHGDHRAAAPPRGIRAGRGRVLVVACPSGGCHHLDGEQRADRRVAYARAALAEAGLDPDHLRVVHLGIGQAGAFVEAVARDERSARGNRRAPRARRAGSGGHRQSAARQGLGNPGRLTGLRGGIAWQR